MRVLALGLCDDAHRKAVAAKLDRMIKENDYHLNTGFLSTPFLLAVLADNGYADTAFKLLEQESGPSWLHNVLMGATTIPEGWDSMDTLHGSLNHYSYGAVCDFLFSYVAGIQLDPDVPGWQRFLIKPLMGGTLTEAEAAYESPYGRIVSAWEKQGDKANVHIVIPANTAAEVCLPGLARMTLGSGEYRFCVTLQEE